MAPPPAGGGVHRRAQETEDERWTQQDRPVREAVALPRHDTDERGGSDACPESAPVLSADVGKKGHALWFRTILRHAEDAPVGVTRDEQLHRRGPGGTDTAVALDDGARSRWVRPNFDRFLLTMLDRRAGSSLRENQERRSHLLHRSLSSSTTISLGSYLYLAPVI